MIAHFVKLRKSRDEHIISISRERIQDSLEVTAECSLFEQIDLKEPLKVAMKFFSEIEGDAAPIVPLNLSSRKRPLHKLIYSR